jgi:hypothetical protein
MTQYYLTFDFVAKRKTIPPHDSILVLFDFAAIGNDCVKSRNVQTLNITPTPFLVRYESLENAL